MNADKNSTTLKSAERTARFLRKYYSEVFEECPKKEGILPPEKMSAVQQATM